MRSRTQHHYTEQRMPSAVCSGGGARPRPGAQRHRRTMGRSWGCAEKGKRRPTHVLPETPRASKAAMTGEGSAIRP
ncbi:hypothetical protein NDU88_003319 [Pleurodeles waltl]|uniref:Uncharacterized protein n=1 Tax=Pleurodeles waltl TaxID=8319 RepID=A0AAV7VH14_PLEWA|nr:hypothetical protein NDU88_003319 [Pleurodeles waltl]